MVVTVMTGIEPEVESGGAEVAGVDEGELEDCEDDVEELEEEVEESEEEVLESEVDVGVDDVEDVVVVDVVEDVVDVDEVELVLESVGKSCRTMTFLRCCCGATAGARAWGWASGRAAATRGAIKTSKDRGARRIMGALSLRSSLMQMPAP